MSDPDVPQTSAEQRRNMGQLAPPEGEPPIVKALASTREVYFVEALCAGLIKIGVANHAKSRFQGLCQMSPVPLTLLGVIRCDRQGALEPELHERFAAYRAHGEWFHDNAELRTVIAAQCNQPREQRYRTLHERRLANARRRNRVALARQRTALPPPPLSSS